jgi:hypothetical protein
MSESPHIITDSRAQLAQRTTARLPLLHLLPLVLPHHQLVDLLLLPLDARFPRLAVLRLPLVVFQLPLQVFPLLPPVVPPVLLRVRMGLPPLRLDPPRALTPAPTLVCLHMFHLFDLTLTDLRRHRRPTSPGWLS